MRRAHLPILEPCGEDWSAMSGDERRRHCSSCDREVLHLSAMTAEEARRALVARPGERVCVRYSCDADDNIVFAGPRLRAAVLATALAGCTASEAIEEPPRVPGVEEAPELPEACDEEPVVEEDSGQCEGELPGPVDPGEVVEIAAAGEMLAVGTVSMGVPAMVAISLPPMPLELEQVAVVGGQPRPAEPRRVVPLDSWMGAVPPDLLAGAVPRRRVDE